MKKPNFHITAQLQKKCFVVAPQLSQESLLRCFYVTETGTTKSQRANIDTLLLARQSDKRHQHHAAEECPNCEERGTLKMNVLFELRPADQSVVCCHHLDLSIILWLNKLCKYFLLMIFQQFIGQFLPNLLSYWTEA